MALIDSHKRTITYLRIGVTDRCNLRCRYCMPEKGIDFSAKKEILTYEEIIRISKVFRGLGISKVRLTGGEPFVRNDIGQLIESLKGIFPKVHITTNATLLDDYIPMLQKVGIDGLNISIDSLDRDRFFMITRRDQYENVISSINKCLEFNVPIKLNVVVMKGVNDDEILDFVDYGIRNNIEVRFIEAMPFNEDDGNLDVFMNASDILARIASAYPDITSSISNVPSSSNTYTIGSQHKVGIIPSYSRSLCGSCDRIRLTPKGEMLNCLYSLTGLDLKALVRDPKVTDSDLAMTISSGVLQKKKNGFEEEALRNETVFRSMTTIGG